MASFGLVFNWFSELERVYFDHVIKEVGHDRVWMVGPLQPTEVDSSAKRSGSRPELASDISFWLDTCEDRTMVFVIWVGERVELSFYGVSRRSKRTRRGRLWRGTTRVRRSCDWERVDSKKIGPCMLRHRAIEAFLTHCGRNLVLEGLVVGVPMLT
ncbi:hypothetical protein HYC85_030039 [Camellia sinensis]|uniref:Uncharacterized protein n=1 Tax=Camellia sinensis TaxID=4442 RepID=A0A7J7G2A2_CAMSI|nr:hypothetical protein HYC85_030039 [Camellia sinensis]